MGLDPIMTQRFPAMTVTHNAVQHSNFQIKKETTNKEFNWQDINSMKHQKANHAFNYENKLLINNDLIKYNKDNIYHNSIRR
jgi:hypothetical protein